jgi:penicillin V acylase-like amidase (Ntn superfamily)
MVNPDIAQGSAVSARTMDFSKIDLNTTVNIVPAGSTLWSGMLNDDLTGSAAGDVNKQGVALCHTFRL